LVCHQFLVFYFNEPYIFNQLLLTFKFLSNALFERRNFLVIILQHSCLLLNKHALIHDRLNFGVLHLQLYFLLFNFLFQLDVFVYDLLGLFLNFSDGNSDKFNL